MRRFGGTSGAGGLPSGIPIHAIMGDSHAALFGHAIRSPGEVKATYGTGSSLMTVTETPVLSGSGLSTTIAWRRGERTTYALEGNISVSAQAAAWMVSFLGLKDVAALTALAETVESDGGVTVVPAFAGLGAPHWNDRARAAISGLSLATSRAEVARATLEAIALQIRDVFAAMESDLGHRLDRLSVDGGATHNDTLMQMQSDVLGRPVRRHEIAELSAAGAGVMAGVACGFWTEEQGLAILSPHGRVFEPALSPGRTRRDRQALAARRARCCRQRKFVSSHYLLAWQHHQARPQGRPNSRGARVFGAAWSVCATRSWYSKSACAAALIPSVRRASSAAMCRGTSY